MDWGLVPVFEVRRVGVVGHGLAVINPLTAPLTHVVGTLYPELAALLVGLRRAVSTSFGSTKHQNKHPQLLAFSSGGGGTPLKGCLDRIKGSSICAA